MIASAAHVEVEGHGMVHVTQGGMFTAHAVPSDREVRWL